MSEEKKINDLLDAFIRLDVQDKEEARKICDYLEIFDELYERTVCELTICMDRTINEDEYYRFGREREVALEILVKYLEIVLSYFDDEFEG